jgi:hypothetical protein
MGGGEICSEDLQNLYSSPRVIRVIRCREGRRTRNIARMGDMRNASKMSASKTEGKGLLEDLRVDGG